MDEARDVASHLIANPEKALDTLARESLDERRRSQESALVFQELYRSVDPHGRSEAGGRGGQGRGAQHQDGRHDATHHRRLGELRGREVGGRKSNRQRAKEPTGRLLVLKPTGRSSSSGRRYPASSSIPDRAALPRLRHRPARHSRRLGSGPKRTAQDRRPIRRAPAGSNLQAAARP
jgi:hypothetical protein